MSTTYNITPQLHVGAKFKTILSYPTPEQTKQSWYGTLRFRWRNFYRIIWDDQQRPYPMAPRTDGVLDISSKNVYKFKYWGYLTPTSSIETANNDIITGYIKIDPSKSHWVTDLDANKNIINIGMSYTHQDKENTGQSYGFYGKLCGYLKLFAGGSVPGLPALNWRVGAAVNIHNLTKPTFGIDLDYTTEHRVGYDTLYTPKVSSHIVSQFYQRVKIMMNLFISLMSSLVGMNNNYQCFIPILNVKNI